MKKNFLALGIMLTAVTVTFAHESADRRERKELRAERKEERTERREIQKKYHKLRRMEDRNEVSYFTRDQFPRDFSDATDVRFVKTKLFDEVLFMSGNKSLIAYYDNKNKLIGTTQKKNFADLPESAQKKISKRYAGYSADEVFRFVDNESNESDMNLYETPFDDADNYFVEVTNGTKAIVLKVDLAGNVTYFKELK